MCSNATTNGGRSESRSKSRRSSTDSGIDRRRSSRGDSNNGGGGGPVWNTENKQDTTSASPRSDDMPPNGAASFPSPLIAGARPSRMMLRVSICFALLSACCGWVLSRGGERLATLARISDQVRVGLVSPWVSRKKVRGCGVAMMIHRSMSSSFVHCE